MDKQVFDLTVRVYSYNVLLFLLISYLLSETKAILLFNYFLDLMQFFFYFKR